MTDDYRRRLIDQMQRHKPALQGSGIWRIYVFGGMLVLCILLILLYGPGLRKRAAEDDRTKPDRASMTAESGGLPVQVPVVQDEAAKEARKAHLATILDGALADQVNGADFVENEGYRKLLQSFLDHRPDAPRAPRDLVVAKAMSDPLSWQGEWVTYRGVLAGFEAVRLKKPIWDRVDVYRGVVTEPDIDQEAVVFDMLEMPPKDIEVQAGAVDVEGHFLRTVKYEARGGNKIREVPYLLVRSIRKAPQTGTPTAWTKQNQTPILIVLGLAILWAAFRIFLLFRRRGAKELRPPTGIGSAENHLRVLKGSNTNQGNQGS